MSYLTFVTPILAALPADTFAEVITGDAVSQGKPHPEPYLKAAHGLGVHPSRCLAIEDTHTGARSAVAAGCDTVLVVPHHVPVVEGERRVFADSLAGLSAATLPGPWGPERPLVVVPPANGTPPVASSQAEATTSIDTEDTHVQSTHPRRWTVSWRPWSPRSPPTGPRPPATTE